MIDFQDYPSRTTSELNSDELCLDEPSFREPTDPPVGLQDQLLNGSTDCIFVVGPDWRFSYLNPAAEREISQGRSLVGEVLWEAFPEARRATFEDQYRRAMDLREQVKFEAYFQPLKSWYEVKASPLPGGGIGVWFTNITGRKANEVALAVLEERYRFAAKATNDLIWDWDLVTDSVLWNDSAGSRLGYHDQNLGETTEWFYSRVHPGDVERVRSSVHECIAGTSQRFAVEYRLCRADGTYADVVSSGFLTRDSDGRAARLVGSIQDHSERNQLLREVQKQKANLATVFGQAMVGIMLCEANGRAIMINERFCNLVGRSADDMRNCTVADYTHPDDLTWNLPLLEAKAAAAEGFEIEKRYIRPDGSVIWCQVNVSFLAERDQGPKCCIVVAQDISERKAAQDALSRQSDLLQTVVDSVSDLIFVKDRHGRFVLANRALEEGCGELVGSRTFDRFASAELSAYELTDQEVITTGEPRTLEEVIPVMGEPRLFHTVKVPWVQNGEIAGVIGVSRDVTERKSAEVALQKSETLYRGVLEGSADCIKIIDLEGKIELINTPGLCSMEIEDNDAIRGQLWANLWPEQSRDVVDKAVADAVSGETTRFTADCPTAKGTPKSWDVMVSPMTDDNGQVTRVLSISRDITSQRQVTERLKWTSEHDGLTELPNRTAFHTRLQAATIRAMASEGKVGLLLLDIDHFKHVNDTLGHAAGDHVLSAFGKRLLQSVRAGDFVARLGGDEFAVILEHVEEEEDLVRAGNSILSRLADPIRLYGRTISAGASIGGALFPRDAQTAHELFNNADSALYAIKEGGRGSTKLFHTYMREEAQKAAAQLSFARIAVSHESVEPHYQQKVDLQSGSIVGYEALLRWRHPRRGIQLPDTVAEAFKDFELASKIGELMQQKVLSDIHRWMRQGHAIGSVAINAAPAEFLRDDFAERLLERMRQAAVPPHLVEIEVTEHVFYDRASEFVRRALQALKKAGVRIALDDFGTGYSSLSHLRDFPVDVVKIDQSFIAGMGADPAISSIVAAVVSLASSLKIDVVAEGIETNDQLELLQEMGCGAGQGYLFGRPVEADDVPHFTMQSSCGSRKKLRVA